ncbi:MAG TPA: AbgT family transporter [Amaricoccus sp.]|uniref:AbgT family transporter n=1 Tax=Amaricoccus sp. TaxID=1872485 RepID=UPI002C06DCF6|nr:AbgT family transporter [Amaricoccus sp.]HMQ93422.1 AbgT family transporter [Amaricoccus sp.]HMR52759.1 AbgT family transporter [Amaricoccus sp.]HMR60929.1 AbgT family transporter [Amaricoccus sp.]HMT99699.1 AbgT family transporter [Amaricoccus sp.]
MEKDPVSGVETRSKAGFLDGFLTTIERVGNKVPHPAIIFFILIGLVIVLSVILSLIGWSATYEAVDPVSHEVVERTTAVRSLLSADGIRFMFTSIVPNFLGFGAVGVIIVAMIGVGLAEESGLIATLVRKIVEIAPRSIFTFIIVMLGVVSSIAADAGYLVLVPLGAAAFHSLGRHPLAGLAAAFSGVAGVFLVNLFVTPTDALLAEMTNDAIHLVDPNRNVTLVGNLYFMIASSILMGIVCTILTEKVVEPHLGPYEGGVPVEAQAALSPEESRGLRYTGWALLGFVIVIGLLTVPPGAPLRHPETGEILSGSPFMSGLIVLISALFFTIGFAYGKGAGTVKDLTAAIGMIVKTFSGLAGLIFLLLVIAQFIAFFNFTNIATVLAANLAEFLETVPLGGVSYIIIFVVVIFLIDILITGAVAKWAIFAPVFIPLFMRLGGDPDLVLAAYRVGDSPANVITPLNVYLGVMVGFAAKYQKDAGIGTIVSLMLPYTVVLMVLWTLLLVVWYVLGLPLGPA